MNVAIGSIGTLSTKTPFILKGSSSALASSTDFDVLLIFLNQQHMTGKGTVTRFKALRPSRGRCDTSFTLPEEEMSNIFFNHCSEGQTTKNSVIRAENIVTF